MEEKLLQLLNQKEYTKMTPSEIAKALQIKDDDFKLLMKSLNALEDKGIIYITKNGYIHLAKNLKIYIGEIIQVRKYYAICKVSSMDEKTFEVEIPIEELQFAYKNDIVRIQLTHQNKGKVLEIIRHNRWELICEYKNRQWICDDKFFPYEIKITNRNIKVVDGQIALLTIKKYDHFIIHCEIKKILGHRNDPGIDILSEVIKSGVPYEFSDKLLDYCQKIIQNKPLDLDQRVDLTNQLIVTIDGLDAKDLDDAISLKINDHGNYELGVHIADVSYYVSAKNLIDQEAYRRGTSIYLADRVIPMLPHLLSNGICSLNENEIRLTISCVMEIDAEGNVIHYDIFPSYICSKGRLNYQDVNALFAHQPYQYSYSSEMKEMLFLMRNLSSILTKKMLQNGYLDLDIKEAKLIVNEDTHQVERIEQRMQGEAEKLIENFMILANETVASHIYYQQLPFIYRVHPAPTLEKLMGLSASLKEINVQLPIKGKKFHVKELQKILESVRKTDKEDIVSNLILRSLNKAIYSVENVGHFGLGSSVYTHFTSPIRRYPDLLVHRYLRQYEFCHQYDVDLDFLVMAAENSSVCERRAIALEREVEDIKKAEFMSKWIGATFEGVITGVMDFGVFVQLENTCEGLMRYETIDDFHGSIMQHLKVGHRVIVRLISVNIKNGEINFAYVQVRNRRKKA